MMKFISVLSFTLTLLMAFFLPAQAQTGETALKPGDQVRITITGVPPADQQSMALTVYIVSNDGTIRLQHLKNEVRAAGMTPTDLARSVQTAYKAAKIYTNPAINISRNDSATTVLVVTVSGNVKSPGSVVFRPGMLINDAISEKNGPDEFANMKKVKLIRRGSTREMDLSSISSNPALNIPLEPGDTVMVPASGFFNKGR